MVSTSDVDRLFLQAVLSRGVMSSKLAQLLWEKSIEAVNCTLKQYRFSRRFLFHLRLSSLERRIKIEVLERQAVLE